LPEIHILEFCAIAHNQLIDSLVEARQKFVTLNEICTKWAACPARTPALIAMAALMAKGPANLILPVE
jgi:hypothetical protein